MKNKVICSVAALITCASVMLTACDKDVVSSVTLDGSSLKEKVSSTGYIRSTDENNIFAPINSTINEVNVEVGDVVKAGDILCLLDTDDLEASAAAARTALSSGTINTDYALSQAEKDYLKMRSEMASGTYQPIVLAERNVEMTKTSLDIAKRNYDEKVSELSDESDLEVWGKKSALAITQSNLTVGKASFTESVMNSPAKTTINLKLQTVDEKRSEYLADKSDANKKAYDDAAKELSKYLADYPEILSMWNNLYANYVACDSAELEYEIAKSAGGDTAKALKDALTTAQLNYDGAVKDLASTKTEAEKALSDLERKIENDKAVADFTAEEENLRNLEQKIADCTVKAVSDGTITAVYAKEGAIASGMLFTVENTENLEVLAKFKEYDIASIEVGMPVVVKADATGSQEYEGKVEKIAPTAVKNNTSADTEFEVTISVKSEGTKLLIGMKAKVEVIIEEKNNVYLVPIDAVRYDDDDNAFVYAAVASDGGYTADRCDVSTGEVTDNSIEIYGADISDGMIIITDGNEKIKQGTVVSVAA